jgi:hypothetical protein
MVPMLKSGKQLEYKLWIDPIYNSAEAAVCVPELLLRTTFCDPGRVQAEVTMTHIGVLGKRSGAVGASATTWSLPDSAITMPSALRKSYKCCSEVVL